jgi:hypothetical protein
MSTKSRESVEKYDNCQEIMKTTYKIKDKKCNAAVLVKKKHCERTSKVGY